jgi:hypothetical protein
MDGIYTGGLVGNVSGTDVRDRYALGNVLADKTAGNGTVNVGGLVGTFGTTGRVIQRCFSAGTVTAQSAGSGALNAGGVMGRNESGTITLQNCVALGAAVTAKGSGTKNIGRVYGVKVGTTQNNYAVDTMLLFEGTPYNNPYPGVATPSPGDTGDDGADATDSDLRSQMPFWNTRGFTEANGWNFSSVYSKRYPAIAGLGGQ